MKKNFFEQNLNFFFFLKLIRIWEENKYFSPAIMVKLKAPSTTFQVCQQSALNEHQVIVADIKLRIQAQYQKFEQQHNDFVRHVEQQIGTMNAQGFFLQSVQGLFEVFSRSYRVSNELKQRWVRIWASIGLKKQ